MKKRKQAAEEVAPPINVGESLKEDDKYKSFRRIVRNIGEQVNTEKMREEILRLHAGRKVRTLYLKRPGVDAVVDAALQDSSYRSRIAEIRIETDYHRGLLEEAVDKMRKHVVHEFSAQVSGLKTKGERMSFADQFLQKGVTLLYKFERLTAMADTVIKDIDQSGYTLKHVVDSMEVLYSSKNDKKNV